MKTSVSQRLLLFTLLGAGLVTSTSALAASPRVKASINRAESPDRVRESLILPYAFSTETMGLNLGVGGMIKGWHQDQMTLGATAFGGDVSKGGWAGVFNYRLPSTERWFVSAHGLWAYYPDQRAYAGGSVVPIAADKPLPGSNDSSPEQYFEADGNSNWFDSRVEYTLPLGAGKERGMLEYQLKDGLLVSEPSGGGDWNPLDSGVTVAMLRLFSRYQSFEFESQKLDGDFSAWELGLLYDNTDFATNPSYGSRQWFSYSSAIPSTVASDWDFWQLSASKFFSFGESDYAHQRVLALNMWTGYSPSWELEVLSDGSRMVRHGAPYNEGATLGGFTRMRGYDLNRFHDKAALYASAEYRYTLKYNPLEDVHWLRFLRLDWFQLVGFVEAGRVAPEYKLSTLTDEMKFDYGLSLRALTAGLVVRADLAKSDEGTNLWLMVDHPF
ncbi:BamA/TamA family outer membrane protein [Shewanella sp. JM162201]|uniref:BamA/TamA family outer membrane protein n=1 Tax=Shewanella jiangmenensis TaxID=2837387 RepID=A0ABS5V2N4_9GAMM|nr:BamA/TamA family outer membrane protein [Shewanella jiangmenensis]MBT1444203.1 BamA/TamA family outer membrane protein [Shewanella jiangmenensis]